MIFRNKVLLSPGLSKIASRGSNVAISFRDNMINLMKFLLSLLIKS